MGKNQEPAPQDKEANIATGNFYGELFYGVAKSHLRQITHHILLNKKYNKIVYFCCGSFNLAKVAVEAGYRPEQIYCSDISLYSSLLGYLFSGQKIEDMPKLELPKELRKEIESTDDEFEKVALIMYEMRRRNLAKMSYRLMELGVFQEEKETFVKQYCDKLHKEYEKLGGIHYEIADLREVIKDEDEKTLFLGYPPINTNDYEKMFDYGKDLDLLAFEDVDVFAPDEFPRMFNDSVGWKSDFLAFTTHRFSEIDKKHIFAAKYNGQGKYDYMLFNHCDILPKEVKNKLIIGKIKPYTPLKDVSIFDPKTRLTGDEKITIIPIKAEHSLYYRELWIHNLGSTSASNNFGLFIDGKIAGVFGIADSSSLFKMQVKYAFLQYTAMVSSDIYSNFVSLLEWCATCTEFKQKLYATLSNANRFYRLDGIKTVSLTKHKYVKASRGIFEIIDREYDKKLKLNKISEYAKFRKETYQDCLIKYLKEAKERKK